MNLVYLDNKRPITDSLIVAETFGKEHRRVMQDIREMDCSQEFNEHHFVLTSYKDAMNREKPKYLITQDGFSFLVMGYTGKEAARFKEMYINEFNLMKDQLNKSFLNLPQNYKEALIALVGQVEKTELLEAQLEATKPLTAFAESLQVATNSILIGELAKLLKQNGINIGRDRLFETLRREGYLMRHGSQYNAPTQRSMDLKLMEVKVGIRASTSDGTKATQTTKITGKGIMYFINKFKEVAVSA